ncbi:MAG: hypothetical protein H6579_02180 [Chitinophagales bacterium]|nr:hypothetical protein [Chitinophagales bacterium]
MKNIFLSLGFLFFSLFSFQNSFAQLGKEGDELLSQLQSLSSKLKTSYLKENFKLTETEAKAFWAVYNKYNTNAEELAMKMQNRSENVESKNATSDQQKLANLEYQMKVKMIKLEQAIEFNKQLREVLSDAKVLEFYKIEKEFEKKLEQALH